LLDWGYPILAGTLAQAGALSLFLILAPLWLLRGRRLPVAGKWRIAVYFLAIGLAFLFVEIASIQRFMLFLGHPLYAISVVLCGFLLFAGSAAVLPGGSSAACRRRISYPGSR
jgi:hypothetical protein